MLIPHPVEWRHNTRSEYHSDSLYDEEVFIAVSTF